jgi:hypothetical protein
VLEVALQPNPEEKDHYPKVGEEGQKLMATGRQHRPRAVEQPKTNPDEQVAEQVGEVKVLERGFRKDRQDDNGAYQKDLPGCELHFGLRRLRACHRIDTNGPLSEVVGAQIGSIA